MNNPAPHDQPEGQTGSLPAEMRSARDDQPPPGLPAPHRRRIHAQTLMTIAVVAASVASLFMMRRFGMGSGMTFQTVKIDYTQPSSFDEDLERRILQTLEASSIPFQIPADRLRKNPFILDSAEGSRRGVLDPDAESRRLAEERRREAEQREGAIRSALAGLRLNGVMQGRIPLARINSQTVRVGDIIGEHFTITAIHERSVELRAEGQTFTINMSDGAMKLDDPYQSSRPPR